MGGGAAGGEAMIKAILLVVGIMTALFLLPFGLIFGGAALLPKDYYWTAVKTWLFCLLFFLPTLVYFISGKPGKKYGILTSIVHCLILLVLFWVYAYLYKIPLQWLIFASGFYAFNHLGGLLIYYLQQRTVRRYETSKKLYLNDLWKDFFKSMLDRQKIVYLCLPLGFAIAIVAGALSRYNAAQVFQLSIRWCLLLGGALQFLILLFSFRKIIAPLTGTRMDQGQEAFDAEFFLERQPPAPPKTAIATSLRLDLAVAVTDLRKILFYNATLNAIILASFVFMLFSIYGHPWSIRTTLIIYLIAVFLFSQLPYSIGQKNMHGRLLDKLEGADREDTKDKLNKMAPFLPKFPFLASLTSGFTAGGLIWYILDHLFKDTLTK